MLTLSLLRHAKSSWKNPALPDHERSLSDRGKVAAPLMGQAIAERGLVPSRVLCSSSRRTKETLDLVLPYFSPPPEVRIEDELYHAEPHAILDMVRQQSSDARNLMLVGHNPGFHELGYDLVGSGPLYARDRLSSRLPTCGLAVINFPAGSWQDVDYRLGELSLFLVPADLGLTPSPIDP